MVKMVKDKDEDVVIVKKILLACLLQNGVANLPVQKIRVSDR